MAAERGPDGNLVLPLNITRPAPVIDFTFKWATAGGGLRSPPAKSEAAPDLTPQPELGSIPPTATERVQFEDQMGFLKARESALGFPLTKFAGPWTGNGFNTIFVPLPFGEKVQEFKGVGFNDNLLVIDLTTEQWTFGPTLGDIPNRGFGLQGDIHLHGVPYLQTVQRVTDKLTGRPRIPSINKPEGIHFEPGMFLLVPPAATFHQGEPLGRGSVVRMASIPHGTTINAQGPIPKKIVTPETPTGGFKGGPRFSPLDITPFKIGNPFKKEVDSFPSVTALSNPFRDPQNLQPFLTAETLTMEMVKNPHKFLERAVDGQKIVETVVFEVHTGQEGKSTPPALMNGGGTTNIAFLAGAQSEVTTRAPNPGKPNAHAESMVNTWWVETVMYDVEVDPMAGNEIQTWKPKMLDSKGKPSTAPTPEFLLKAPPAGVPKKTTFKVPGTQIQYSQVVNLNFGGLSWPHVSVATLVPKEPQFFPLP
ncbi:hypothetical protein QBC47DRAFT_296862 [Echria macrotheca]|uniref:Uncharacterized protein n=1 Tax=Echria macrotheca TaxID=438768 RepID=A0AAJ0BH02_9PEZI|nr:hypothetical protein QBC47DRAFT_296862 [Echria macrotheca]